ncbi:MAG: DDE-type integrase/transposase/recombinase [Bacteroidota bacterium]
MDQEKIRNEIALFKFSLIAPIINGTMTGSIKDYLEGVCAKPYQIPYRGLKELSPNTVRRWLLDYRRHGLDGLKRKPRQDKGFFRQLSHEIAQTIREIKSLNPNKTATAIYHELLANGLLNSKPVSLSTIQRYLKQFDFKSKPDVERKRFVFECANDCWQTDVLVGPYLLVNGKKKCTFLIAFLDDASRLITGGQFFFEENTSNLLVVLKKAILKRGISKRLFTDNGKIFSSLQLRMICASLGIILSHARPYSPASKGKIERVFRTIRTQFLETLELAEIQSLDDLNNKFTNYVESSYNLRPHSSLNNLSPLSRYLQDKNYLRFVSAKNNLDEIFLHEAIRKVNNDATIALNKQIFEVPQNFIGQSVTVRFDPEDLSKVYLKAGEPPLMFTVYPVQTVDNSKVIRKQNQKREIDFAGLFGGGTTK